MNIPVGHLIQNLQIHPTDHSQHLILLNFIFVLKTVAS